MRTIRANCFETNSSSTHSVTIQSKSKTKSGNAQLVIDGILRPENLRYTPAYRSGSGDSHTLHAGTCDQKAALFIHHLKSLQDYGYDYGDHDEASIKKLINFTVEQLISRLKYVGINTSFSYSFGYASEDNDTYIDTILDADVPEDAIVDHIFSVIMDDDIVIIDSEDAY